MVITRLQASASANIWHKPYNMSDKSLRNTHVKPITEDVMGYFAYLLMRDLTDLLKVFLRNNAHLFHVIFLIISSSRYAENTHSN